MAPEPLPDRPQRGAWMAVAVGLFVFLPVSGCTKILGIDGTFAVESNVASGGKKSGGAGGEPGPGGSDAAGADGGSTGAGGADGTGGAGGASGTIGAGDGGSGNAGANSDGGAGGGSGAGGGTDAGCPSCVQPPTCRPGHYTGTFAGDHSPSITVVPGVVKLQVSGAVSFRLDGTGPVLQMLDGKLLNGQLVPYGTFTGVLTGTFTCATQHLDAIESGQVAAAALQMSFKGPFQGDFRSGVGNGTWSEHEVGVPSSVGNGSGTWTASYAGP